MKKNYMFAWTLLIAILILTVVMIAMTLFEAKQLSSNQGLVTDNQLAIAQFKADLHLEIQPVRGERDAPVQIVEFGDYKSPYSKEWEEQVYPKLEEEYIASGKAAYYYLHNPLSDMDSHLAARAAEYLMDVDENLFWRFHTLLYKKEGFMHYRWGTEAFILDLLRVYFPEVDIQTFIQRYQSESVLSMVLMDQEAAKKYGVDYNPTIFINGKLAEDSSYESIKKLIDKELALHMND